MSISKRLDLLRSILSSPKSIPESQREELIIACRSQGSFAKYSSADFDSVSLNTLKSHAEADLPYGFEGLDQLRKSALETLVGLKKEGARPNRGTLADLQQKNNEKDLLITQLVDEITIMTAKLDEVMQLAKTFSEKSGQQEYFASQQRAIFAKFAKK